MAANFSLQHQPFVATFAVIVACLAAHGTAPGATITLRASKDNTLYQDAEGDVSNGQGRFLFVGRTGTSGGLPLRRGLIGFDLSSIPAGSIITDATLSLYMSRSSPSPAAVSISLHLAAKNWGEGASDAGSPGGLGTLATTGDATWLHNAYDTSRWTTAGGDFRPTASATTSVNADDRRYAWAGAGLTADVQAWVNNPATNFGWFIRGDEVTDASAQRFNTRENTANVPQLSVTFTIPEPSVGVLGAAGSVLAFRRRRGVTQP